ncbi:MAG: hypothetical protein HEP71_13545 [Roseivirga sp.]|nr:hypothetical protein [Roseivirga sp.]
MSYNMIFKLMVRDLSVYRLSFLLISFLMLAVGMVTIFINTNTVGMFTSSGSSISTVVMAAYMSELKTRSTWIHTASLPITKKAMVTARFLTSVLICALNLLLWFLAFNLLSGSATPAIGAEVILFTWVQVLFQLALYFFVFYRFNMIVVMGVYLLPTVLWAVFSPKATPMSDLVIGNFQVFLIWILVSLGLFIASYFSAISYLKKKDL